MQFNVPQFIDIEDKIFGPLTLKQFIYVIVCIVAAFIFYSFLPIVVAVLLIVPVVALTYLLAFNPIHGRPFSVVLESAFKYALGDKLYLWKKERGKDAKTVKTALGDVGSLSPLGTIPKVTEGHLDDMALSLDIQHKIQNNQRQ